jgi:hypothetical protein
MEAALRSALLRSTLRRIATLMLVSSLAVASPDGASPAGNAQASTDARWVPRTIHFMYSAVAPSSETTFYSCDGLQSRITEILNQLGARVATIKPFGCFTNEGPERFPGVDATFSVLEPADSGGQSESTRVKAHWQTVILNTDDACALMEQVKRNILPLFATRNQTPGCSPAFRVDVLQAIGSKVPAL